MSDVMKLRPVCKDYLWGGDRLKSEYNMDPGMSSFAEAWVCSVHPDGQSSVIGGEFDGQTLADVLEEHPAFLGVRLTARGIKTLPILIKLLDAEKDSSVQVHPNDRYAQKHENQKGKTEMWYVLDARDGAKIVCGFERDITKEQLYDAVSSGTLDSWLHHVDVHGGDVLYIPAGTIHGIGAGMTVVEIQESSNVTYRVYDYDRVDKNGEKRELHVDKAAETLKKSAATAKKPAAPFMRARRRVFRLRGYSAETLCVCRFFRATKICVRKKYTLRVGVGMYRVVLCTEGEGEMTDLVTSEKIRIKKGDCFFVPATNCRYKIYGRIDFVLVR